MANIKNRWRWQPGNKIGFKPMSRDLVIDISPFLENKGVSGELIIPATAVGAFLRQSQEAIRKLAIDLREDAKVEAKKPPEPLHPMDYEGPDFV